MAPPTMDDNAAHMELWSKRIKEFIRANREDINRQALRWLTDTTVPDGLYNVLVAYCAEVVGKDDAFLYTIHWIVEVAIEDLNEYRKPPTPEHFPLRLKVLMDDRRVLEMPMPPSLKGSTLHQYLEGKTTPSLARLVEIANDLGVSPAWLAFGTGLPDDHIPNGLGVRV